VRSTGFLIVRVSAALLALGFGVSACAPVFQDARLVEPGRVQVTPSVSGAGFTGGGDSEYVATTFAAQIEAGVMDRLSLGAAYARFQARGCGGLNTVAFGPKIGIVTDRVALAVPASFAFDVSDSWEFHPMALFTLPIGERTDFNPSVRLLIPACEGCETLLGINGGFGLRLRPDLTIRPETGILFNPGERGTVWTFGLGVSVRPWR
jgi:hypothetical protein